MRGVVSGGINEPTGDAVAADLLADKTASTALGKIVGTMVDNGDVSTDITTVAQEVTIAEGNHGGGGVVKISATEQAKITTANILGGITMLGVAGSAKRRDAGSGLVSQDGGTLAVALDFNASCFWVFGYRTNDYELLGMERTMKSGRDGSWFPPGNRGTVRITRNSDSSFTLTNTYSYQAMYYWDACE